MFPVLESALNKNRVDWPQQLLIKHGNLFLKLLRNRTESTKLEVDGLVRILDEFKVPNHFRILDVSCGIGRHSIPLAEKGIQCSRSGPLSLIHRQGECDSTDPEGQVQSGVSRCRCEKDCECTSKRATVQCDSEPLEFIWILRRRRAYSNVHCSQKPDGTKRAAN